MIQMTGTISYRNGRTEQIEITQREWSDWELWALKRGIPSQVSEGTAMTWTRFLGYAAAMRAAGLPRREWPAFEDWEADDVTLDTPADDGPVMAAADPFPERVSPE